jgi:hypothetical protein
MPKKMFHLIPIIFLLFYCSCDPCIGIGGLCADTFQFKIIDKITQQDLVSGPAAKYKPDSIRLFPTTTLAGYQVSIAYYDSTKFQTNLGMPTDTLFLKLNSLDTDTLLISYNYVKVRCCKSPNGYGKIFSIEFNGVTSVSSNGIYLFMK